MIANRPDDPICTFITVSVSTNASLIKIISSLCMTVPFCGRLPYGLQFSAAGSCGESVAALVVGTHHVDGVCLGSVLVVAVAHHPGESQRHAAGVPR